MVRSIKLSLVFKTKVVLVVAVIITAVVIIIINHIVGRCSTHGGVKMHTKF